MGLRPAKRFQMILGDNRATRVVIPARNTGLLTQAQVTKTVWSPGQSFVTVSSASCSAHYLKMHHLFSLPACTAMLPRNSLVKCKMDIQQTPQTSVMLQTAMLIAAWHCTDIADLCDCPQLGCSLWQRLFSKLCHQVTSHAHCQSPRLCAPVHACLSLQDCASRVTALPAAGVIRFTLACCQHQAACWLGDFGTACSVVESAQTTLSSVLGISLTLQDTLACVSHHVNQEPLDTNNPTG